MKLLARGLLALVFAAASIGAHAERGHYIVVKVDAQGQARPVHYRATELNPRRQPAQGLPTVAAQSNAASDPDKLVVTAGSWSQIVDAPRLIRGEFAANGVSGRIQSHVVRQAERSFVLRIPASAGKQLTIRNGGARTVLDLEQIARDTRIAAPARAKLTAQAATAAANSGNRVDILVVGEGYTAAEQAKFNADVAAFKSRTFSFTPYKQYANFVNVVPLFVASAQSGADHPPYQAGCTGTNCCADSAAQTDPRAGTFVATAFDGRFCTAQIHRLVTIDDQKVLSAAAAYPAWDQIMVIVNDPVYGGAGGYISVFSTHSFAGDIAIHEFGHSFHKLADEYTSAYPGFPACSDIPGSGLAPCEANVTNQTMASSVKWKAWFTPGIQIPTPSGTAGVGLFQGARYQTTGMYRPANTCTMRELGATFCPVCSQEYVLKLYRGGFGEPAMGIDLIEPGTESPSPGPIRIAAGATRTFSATVLHPSPDTVLMQWYLDMQPIPGATGSSYNFRQLSATPSRHFLQLRVIDTTALVQASEAGIDLEHSRLWDITVLSSARNDFNGDGQSDLLWRHAVTGSDVAWRSASNATPQAVASVNLAWKIAGTGDFNADGKADLFWRNTSNGVNAIWLSANNATPLATASVANLAWGVAGIGDFNGDGKADVFWRNSSDGTNTIWLSANSVTRQAVTSLSVDWQAVAVNDFNGDGKADILWRNANTGANTIWRSGVSSQGQAVTAVTTTAWKVAGSGDFNGDGKADILWRNESTGVNGIWLSANSTTRQTIATVPDLNWKVAAVGDYNGDGRADVLWRHAVSGNNDLWYSGNSATHVLPARVADLNWKVIP